MNESKLIDFDQMLDQLYALPDKAESLEELDGNVEFLSK